MLTDFQALAALKRIIFMAQISFCFCRICILHQQNEDFMNTQGMQYQAGNY